jgi:hypothetical protein
MEVWRKGLKSEPRPTGERPVGEAGERPGEEPVREDVGARPDTDAGRREAEKRGEVISGKLGRVQGTLDTKLSAEESRAFEPEC